MIKPADLFERLFERVEMEEKIKGLKVLKADLCLNINSSAIKWTAYIILSWTINKKDTCIDFSKQGFVPSSFVCSYLFYHTRKF